MDFLKQEFINLLEELFDVFGVCGYLGVKFEDGDKSALVRYHCDRYTSLDNGVTMFENDANVRSLIRGVGDYIDDNFDYRSATLSVEAGIMSVLVSVDSPFTSSNRCSFIVYSPDGSFDRLANNRDKKFVKRFVLGKYTCEQYEDTFLRSNVFYVFPSFCREVIIPNTSFDGSLFGEMGDIVKDFVSCTGDFDKFGIVFRSGWLPCAFFNWRIFLLGPGNGIDDKPKFVGGGNDTVFADSSIDGLVLRLDQLLKSNPGFNKLSFSKVNDTANGILIGSMNRHWNWIVFADEKFFSSDRCSLSCWYPKSQVIYDDGNRKVYRHRLDNTSTVFVSIR